MAKQLTLDQALQKGIEAHKSGKVQKLIVIILLFLKLILSMLMPIITWGYWLLVLVRLKRRYPFFKIALETNPDIAQFWLSYMML